MNLTLEAGDKSVTILPIQDLLASHASDVYDQVEVVTPNAFTLRHQHCCHPAISDSKSSDRKVVGVQVPPPVLLFL